MASSEELRILPCPFCACEMQLATYDEDDLVMLDRVPHVVIPKLEHKPECAFKKSVFCETDEEAIKAWNTRTPSPDRESALREAIGVVEKLKQWCRECQIEKENAGENEKPDFIRQSILNDAIKELSQLLEAK